MPRVEKTVFISYRRVDRWPALAIFKDLTQHGYDVFIDYDGIASGDFERAIVDNIRARAHFIIVLTPTALNRCDDPTDWLRREIETALEARRNIVPLLLDGFRFEEPIAVQRLQGSLEALRRYQALKVPEDFFDPAMERLRSKHLSVAVDAVLHSASAHARQVAHEQRNAAANAFALAPTEGSEAAHSPTLVAQQSAEQQYAAAASNERQAGATRVPFYASTNSKFIGVLCAMALATSIAWIVGSNNGKKQEDPMPSLATTPSIKSPTEGPTNAAEENELGDDFYYGRNGRPRDDAAAVKWYRMASEQGNAAGQASLAFMYEHGRGGLVMDPMQALKLYRQAAAQGNDYAVKALKERFAKSTS